MPIPRDYRIVKNPKLTTRDVLYYVNTYHPLSVNSVGVFQRFNISRAEAAMRLKLLFKWGLVKRTIPKYFKENKRPRGRTPYNYTVSKWGIYMVRKWAEEKGND